MSRAETTNEHVEVETMVPNVKSSPANVVVKNCAIQEQKEKCQEKE
jgi:hypothetical protein